MYTQYADKKGNYIFFLKYKEIQMGSSAKSYMRKAYLYMRKRANISQYMRRPLVIYDFAPDSPGISLYMRKILFSFQCTLSPLRGQRWGVSRPFHHNVIQCLYDG
jgi:hypothetical protein